jgi:protein-disulfide isomerase
MTKEQKTLSVKSAIFAMIALVAIAAIVTGGFKLGIHNGGVGNAVKIPMKTLMDDDAVLGNANATVTIVEFSDYECPFCQRFYLETFPQIKSEYIDTGKVKFVYRDFPLNIHKNAEKAAEAAECAGDQGKYYEMGHMLYTQGVEGGVATFKQYAQDLNLDTEKFNNCLDSDIKAAEVTKDSVAGKQAGVTGTPTFFINGQKISGAQPFSVFKQAIDKALA